MRFLVDANLSPRVAARLCDGGHEASHVQDHGLLNADDEKILHHALDTGHVIISADSDFATMLALTGMVAPSLILLRSADHLGPTEQAHLLLANLPAVLQDLDSGCVVSISQNHLRAGRKPRRRITDLMIASIAIANGLPLYTTNPGDFAGLDNPTTVVAVPRP